VPVQYQRQWRCAVPPISMESATRLPYVAHTERISASCDPVEDQGFLGVDDEPCTFAALQAALQLAKFMRRLLTKYAVRYNL
jgi:hypothetical protein